MLKDKYPAKITELMKEIEKNVISNPEESSKKCAELEAYAKSHREDYLKGFCLFFRGFMHYMTAELEKSMECMSEALSSLIAGEDWRLATKVYNAMGNIADFQGDSSLATDCYIKGLRMSREHEQLHMEYDISSNIANVYIALGDTEHAIEMLQRCEQIGPNIKKLARDSAEIVCANLCQCYLQIGELDKAGEQLERLKQFCGDDSTNMNHIATCFLETEFYHRLGNVGARDLAIKRLDNLKYDSLNVFDAINELCRHCRLLLSCDKIDEFLAMIERIETLATGPAVEEQLLKLRMEYYEKIGDRQNYLEMTGRYYQVARLREEERKKIVSHNLTIRMRLDEEEHRRQEVELSNLQLRQKSERDALTGIHNRYKLNEVAELAFHRAYLNGTPLTVEILDIDCYKQFNDNYGHQRGDECLVRIADAIRSMEEFDGVHTARYGGDEFVIIYEEYNKKDIEKMAQRLHEKIYNLNIEHKFSNVSDRVTVSQGIFHKIPSGGNKTWDFLYGADLVLYGVKSTGKNHYHVGTDFEEVRKYYQDARALAGKK